MNRVIVKCADRTERELALVRDMGEVVLVATCERVAKTSENEIENYLVGFPKSDIVRYN